jgi:hypothetical protein
MVRIILEDIKLNKDKKETIFKNEKVEISSEPVPKINIYQEEKADITDAKIDEYFKSRRSSTQRIKSTPQIRTKSKIFHKPILVFFIICLIGGGIYWGGEFFQKSDITITSKHQIINYNNKQFIASKDGDANAVDFEIMITEDTKLKSIILTEPKEVSVKAKGSITLYNEFSSTPQKLLAGTFLADNNGKTYKTDKAVTVPGYKIDTNKKNIPGQVVVEISAFLPGDAYNGSPTDFYITSFKNTSKYNKIYGKLKTPLSGGASGLVYTLDDLNMSKIDNIAQSTLKDDLLKKVKALVPDGYILYPNATTFSYTIGDNEFSKTPESEIEIKGILSVVLLKEKSLIDNIIKVSLPEIKGDELKEIVIPDLSKLTFNFVNKDQLITKDLVSIPFYFSGDIDAIWKPDIETLKIKMLGVNKSSVLPIFRQDPGVSSAIVKIFPPWQSHIPEDVNKINIILK